MDISYDTDVDKIIGVPRTKDEPKIPKTERKLLSDDYRTMYPGKNGRGFDSWILEIDDESPIGSPMPKMTQSEVIAVEDERRSKEEEELKLERLLTNPDTSIIYIHANGKGYPNDQIILGFTDEHGLVKLDVPVEEFNELLRANQHSNLIKLPRPVDSQTKEDFLETLHGIGYQGDKLRIIYDVDIHFNPDKLEKVILEDDRANRTRANNFFNLWANNQNHLVKLTVGHDGTDLKTIGLKFDNGDDEQTVVLSFDIFMGLTDGTMLGGHNGILKHDTDPDTAKDILKSLKINGILINKRATVKLHDLTQPLESK